MKCFNVFVLIGLFVFCSCGESNQNVTRLKEIPYKIVSDSIYSSMPGDILYQDGIVYWQDARGFENFMHAIDVQTGKEMACFGNLGQGPEDFSAPEFSLSPNGGLYLNDVEKPLEVLYRFSSGKGSFQSSARKYFNERNATSLLHLGDDLLLYLCPKKDKLFHVYSNDIPAVAFGERPITDEINNPYDIFQGKIDYNPHRNLLVYSTNGFPYIAVYRNQEMKNWIKIAEVKSDWDYTVSEGDLRFSPSVKHGAWEMALTDDYVVLLQRDDEVEETMDRKTEGRDVSSIPSSLFVYDYNLNLKKIINMPFRMLRLCGDVESNTVYAMAINPEFELISIDLE